MKITALVICAAGILALGSRLNSQTIETMGGWERESSIDQLSGKSAVAYRFAQKQPDGRTPFIYMFCEDGRMVPGTVRYFADTFFYFDANLARSSYGTDLNTFPVTVNFRGASGKIYIAEENVSTADPESMTLYGKEFDVFGQTGTLVIRFLNNKGVVITDTLSQAGGTEEQAKTMDADCFSGKKKK